jgi:hypothetical protein
MSMGSLAKVHEHREIFFKQNELCSVDYSWFNVDGSLFILGSRVAQFA